jgi:cytochrome c-type biogenesis protein CcmH
MRGDSTPPLPLMLLWVSIALLTLAVTAALVWPLLSARAAPAADDDLAARLAVFRDRRDEIGRERDAGRLTDAEARQALSDLLVQMTEELPPEVLAQADEPRAAAPLAARSGGGRARAAVVIGLALAILVPAISVGIYRNVGSPDIALAQLDGSFERLITGPQAQFDAMIAEIENRLRANPQDGEAWAVLGEAYKMVGNHGAAIEAFEKAVGLLPPNARLLSNYAESIALAAGGEFSGRPTELLEQALAANPNDAKAVALMGAARYRAGDLPAARRYLGQLLASLPEGSEDAARIGEVVARIDGEIAAGDSAAASVTGQAASPSAPPAASATISGRVELAPALAAGLPTQAVVFVTARAADGPRVPVAVFRAPASALPLDFTLGNDNAMDPARPLSDAGPLLIEARVSLAGTAGRAAGDLIGEPAPAKPGDSGIALRIDQVLAQ